MIARAIEAGRMTPSTPVEQQDVQGRLRPQEASVPSVQEEKPAALWPCGHLRTPKNTQRVGVSNGVRCKECRRRIAREWARKVWGTRPENYRITEASS